MEDLARIIDYFAKFDFHHYKMCNALTLYLKLRISDFGWKSLASLARGFCKLGFTSNSIWPLVVKRASELSMSAENCPSIITLAWSLTMLDYFPVYTLLVPLFECLKSTVFEKVREREKEVGLSTALDEVFSTGIQIQLWEVALNYQAHGLDQPLDDDIFTALYLKYQSLAEHHELYCSASPGHRAVAHILRKWEIEHVVGGTTPEGFYVDIYLPDFQTYIEVPAPFQFAAHSDSTQKGKALHVLHRGRREQIQRILTLCGYKVCKIASHSGWKRLQGKDRETVLLQLLKDQGCDDVVGAVQVGQRRVGMAG